ncbi:hypothetical protein K503DRAFT_834561 [Rhizopogon vinicolor AM-OR11-026]|uniref:Uncharacterized protein n=1 Tax=Rhizopogon vinicolor AM-OR11-026 TaxID=1314800 RepID=A0A1B7MNR8_9AGAM|nr:hypothetical protein K503DRAFT_834561 [Rhizopogon vinicolor AM-OR11-026]
MSSAPVICEVKKLLKGYFVKEGFIFCSVFVIGGTLCENGRDAANGSDTVRSSGMVSVEGSRVKLAAANHLPSTPPSFTPPGIAPSGSPAPQDVSSSEAIPTPTLTTQPCRLSSSTSFGVVIQIIFVLTMRRWYLNWVENREKVVAKHVERWYRI